MIQNLSRASFLFRLLACAVFSVSYAVLPQAAEAEVSLGQLAPDFPITSAIEQDSKIKRLSDYRGKYVVLEWFNHGCPFVRKHYSVGNMQKLQKKFTELGVVWLSINSNAEGKEGFLTPEAAAEITKEKEAHPSALVLDPEGSIGKMYGARTTPHLFVINPEGKLIYAGAIDDNDSAKPSTIEGAKNYVDQALTEAMAGKPVSVPSTEPYGCSVKYKS